MKLALAALAAVLALGTSGAQRRPLPIKFEAEFRQICGPRFLDRAAQIYCESAFDENAVSFDHGEGLGQATRIWPEYIRRGWVPADSTPFQVVPAITGAHRYQTSLEGALGGWVPGYCGYNAGAGSVMKAQKLARMAGIPGATVQGSDAFLVTLPQVTKAASRWTINYHKNIQATRALYRKQYGE